jgi:hypothetical protein
MSANSLAFSRPIAICAVNAFSRLSSSSVNVPAAAVEHLGDADHLAALVDHRHAQDRAGEETRCGLSTSGLKRRSA